MTTLCRRLPFLPACDAVAAEGGGRLFWTSSAFSRGDASAEAEGNGNGEEDGPSTPPSPSRPPLPHMPPTLCDLREDTRWRMRHAAAAAGPPSTNDGRPPREREGALWEVYRDLEGGGWSPDASGYSTSFRLPVSRAGGGKSEGDLDRVLASLPPCLSSSKNLGCADIFPVTSGKKAVGRYVAATLGVSLKRCAFLCDDDNDLPLAAAVGKAFVVGVTHPSVERAIAAETREGHIWTTGLEGTLAADAAVEAAGQHLRELLEEEENEFVAVVEKAERAPAFA